MSIKWTFYLKSGKVFDTVCVMTQEAFLQIVNTIANTFKNGGSGYLTLDTCVIAIGECAVVDWEVLDEQKTEES